MTKMQYLENTYLFDAKAQVKEVRVFGDGRTAVILDATIFYPQGGGQPFDTGLIQSDNSQFAVSDVRLDPDGTIYHFGTFERGTFEPAETVALHIDQERRIRNTKSHSAGHLVDCAIVQLGLALKPTKGYHFPEGSYVEYEGMIENSPEMIQAIQEKLDELVSKNVPIMIEELSAEEAQTRGVYAPEGKSARIVGFEGFEPCGCGGTHVRNASEIGKITIRKIKAKGGGTRVAYIVQ